MRGLTATWRVSAVIEDQAQARGSDLHDLDIVRNLNLVGGEVVGVFAGSGAAQVDHHVHALLLEIAQQAGRAAQPNLRLGNDVGGVVEVLGRSGEFDGDAHGDLRDRIVGDSVPHEDGDDQRDQLEQRVVEDEMAEARDHGCSSPLRGLSESGRSQYFAGGVALIVRAGDGERERWLRCVAHQQFAQAGAQALGR